MNSHSVERQTPSGGWVEWYPWGRHKRKAIEQCKKAGERFRVVQITKKDVYP